MDDIQKQTDRTCQSLHQLLAGIPCTGTYARDRSRNVVYDIVVQTRSSTDQLTRGTVLPGVAVLTSGWFSSRLALASGIAAAGSGVGGNGDFPCGRKSI